MIEETIVCFSWETLDSFMQHDVQELCRVVSGTIWSRRYAEILSFKSSIHLILSCICICSTVFCFSSNQANQKSFNRNRERNSADTATTEFLTWVCYPMTSLDLIDLVYYREFAKGDPYRWVWFILLTRLSTILWMVCLCIAAGKHGKQDEGNVCWWNDPKTVWRTNAGK